MLGLDRPPLHSACEHLLAIYGSEKRLEMGNCLIVIPTDRSRHRLMQLLAIAAQEKGLLFDPPEITTLGEFPEKLYAAEKSLATDLAQQIAWSQALEKTPKEEIEVLTGRKDIEDLRDWQPLARVLSKLHTRLASDVWSFNSVAREVAKLGEFQPNELKRWEILREVQKRYYQTLGRANLWDRQAARNYVAAGARPDVNERRCATDKDVVLVATADINRSIASMLAQLVGRITVLVAASEEHADRFDEFGNLITAKWLEVAVDIPDEKILFVESPADQAASAAHFISHLAEDYSTDEVSIGVPAEDLVPQLMRSVGSLNLPYRSLAGRSLSETSPVQLMLACRDYLRDQEFESFQILTRHPDLYRWLNERLVLPEEDEESSLVEMWLPVMDEFQNVKLPDSIRIEARDPFGDPERIASDFNPADQSARHRAIANSKSARLLNQIHDLVSGLLGPLDHGEQELPFWTEPWSEILISVYGQRELDRNLPDDLQVLLACKALHTALANHRHVPGEFGTDCSAEQALDWALEAASEMRVVDPPIADAVEFVGWLDLPLDDAPVMAIVGMNDENVPSSEVGHQFLPNRLCEKLGIMDNNRRFARDVYALTVITSIREQYLLIASRVDEKKDPLKPSRLMFTEDETTSAERAYAFFSYEGKPDTGFWLYDQSLTKERQHFRIPRPQPCPPITQLTVTRFREYLKCPYRFYLNCVLRLDTVTSDWTEMSGGTFGDLAHDVLESFANSSVRDSTSEDDIRTFFMVMLDEETKKRYAGSRLPALRIQIEQLRHRLKKFALIQAKQRNEGWLIASTEELLEHELIVDGQPFVIRGKIDRVDRHEHTNKIAVWDYKTSDSGKKAREAHYKSRKWIDLQLPLYRHLVKEVEAIKDADLSDVSMGYVLLPKNVDDIGFNPAGFDSSMLDDADRTAFDCIRKLREQVFWPPAEKPPIFSEDYAAICQDTVFERDVLYDGDVPIGAENLSVKPPF